MEKEVKMLKRIKLVFKWFFVFIVLGLWSFFVIASSITGSFAKDFNVLFIFKLKLELKKLVILS